MKEKKTFAFKVAQKNQIKTESKNKQWKAREGISVAGCSGSVVFPDLEFALTDSWGRDLNMFC